MSILGEQNINLFLFGLYALTSSSGYLDDQNTRPKTDHWHGREKHTLAVGG
jgi:hypothetical protein